MPPSGWWRRHVTSGLMTCLVAALSFAAVLALVLILGDLIAKGASSLSWDFFTQNPVPAGQTGGGVANAIVGTGIVVGLAALIGLPIGIGTGLYLRSEEHTSELQSQSNLVCRLLLEKKKKTAHASLP